MQIRWSIDQLGHQLYNLKRCKEALLIFKKNAEEFPQRDVALKPSPKHLKYWEERRSHINI
jgi:hypothetical protein